MSNNHEQFGENLRAQELTKAMADGTTYFDENESREGSSLIDESTGESYTNDQDMDSISPEKSIVNKNNLRKDILGEDPAEKWLRENDPNYGKMRKDWGK